jgi:hypothetical protein
MTKAIGLTELDAVLHGVRVGEQNMTHDELTEVE